LDATIYLDTNASCPISSVILRESGALLLATQGNPSSRHHWGRLSHRSINHTSELLADHLGCKPENILWTSGASEANAWIIHSAARLAQSRKETSRFFISEIEHDSVLLAAQSSGAIVTKLRVTPSGAVDLTHFEELLRTVKPQEKPHLISVQYVNNQTGVIQPIEEIAKLCKTFEIPLHVDIVQALGKLPLNVHAIGAQFLTFSGHKIGALKGVGGLIRLDGGLKLSALIAGRQQESLRGGTENAFAIAALGAILRDSASTKKPVFPEYLQEWRSEFEAQLKDKIPNIEIHGKNAPRVCNTSFISFRGVPADSILMNLDLAGIHAGSGSACASGTLEPSHVLLAMGVSEADALSAVRFSAGPHTKWSDYERVLDILPPLIEKLEK